MAQHLIVTNAFGDYARGARITDAATVTQIRDSHNAPNVVAIDAPDDADTSAATASTATSTTQAATAA